MGVFGVLMAVTDKDVADKWLPFFRSGFLQRAIDYPGASLP
jgi:hypothetical protein